MPSQRAPSADLDSELIAALRRTGHRVTPQRLVIHRALRERATHLSAEQVHRATARALPATSLPTVYATLELLAELGLARRLDAGTATVLYDGRTDPHHHAVCRVCGSITDLELELDEHAVAGAARRAGISPHATQLTVTGTCAACRA